MQSKKLDIFLGVLIGIFVLTTAIFVTMFVLETQKKGSWDVSISPCLTKDGKETCGDGFQQIVYSCPKNNCKGQPQSVSRPCVSNQTCKWKVEI